MRVNWERFSLDSLVWLINHILERNVDLPTYKVSEILSVRCTFEAIHL